MIVASQTDPLIGQLIEGRYLVTALLGRGGMGTVYRVEHVMMKKELALKLLLPELSRSEELVRRFEREAEAAARLSHPNIITVTDFGRTATGQLFLVMEMLTGPSLAEMLAREGRPLAIDRALKIERQILRALDHAHQAGVVHRDLKPDNIVLVERDGDREIVKLLDFGIAKMASGEEAGEALTQAGMIYGTPEYLSPEQALGEPVDKRADLYAAGIVLYEMLAGRRPFQADSKLALVSMHITEKAIPVIDAVPGAAIPRALSDSVVRAMEKRREDRWQDAVSFLAALDTPDAPGRTSLPAGVPVERRAVTLSGRVRRNSTEAIVALESALSTRGVPHARLAALGLIGTVAALLTVGLVSWLRGPAPHAASVAGAPTIEAESPSVDRGDRGDRGDRVVRLERTLKSARTCRERKAAAQELIAIGDRRSIGALEAARDRHGGFLGFERANACMVRDLEAGIRKLDGAP